MPPVFAMMLFKIIWSLTKRGREHMSWDILAMVLNAVAKTDLDDKLADAIANEFKKVLPGESFEPVVADFLHLIVDKLKPAQQ
jgi:hypothetical protein